MSMYGIPLSLILFFLATVSMRTNRQSILVWFFAIELMLLAANLLFLTVSVISDTLEGQIVAIFVLTVAAAESRIGLSLLVMYFRTRNTISLASFDRLKELMRLQAGNRNLSWNVSHVRLGNRATTEGRFAASDSLRYKYHLTLEDPTAIYKPITLRRVEAARIRIIRYLRASYPEYLRPYLKIRVAPMPKTPVTKKALGARMGKGKGPVRYTVVPRGLGKRYTAYEIQVPMLPKTDIFLHHRRFLRSKKLGTVVVVQKR